MDELIIDDYDSYYLHLFYLLVSQRDWTSILWSDPRRRRRRERFDISRRGVLVQTVGTVRVQYHCKSVVGLKCVASSKIRLRDNIR